MMVEAILEREKVREKERKKERKRERKREREKERKTRSAVASLKGFLRCTSFISIVL